jgi:hypothetical protein
MPGYLKLEVTGWQKDEKGLKMRVSLSDGIAIELSEDSNAYEMFEERPRLSWLSMS